MPIAFYAGCSSRQTAGPDLSITPAALAALARREPTALLVPDADPAPAFATTWPCVPLPVSPDPTGERACVAR